MYTIFTWLNAMVFITLILKIHPKQSLHHSSVATIEAMVFKQVNTVISMIMTK